MKNYCTCQMTLSKQLASSMSDKKNPGSCKCRTEVSINSIIYMETCTIVIFHQSVGRTNLIMPPLPKLDPAVEKQLWSNPHCISAYKSVLNTKKS